MEDLLWCDEWLSCSESRMRYEAATACQRAHTDLSALLCRKCPEIVCGSKPPADPALSVLGDGTTCVRRDSSSCITVAFLDEQHCRRVAHLHIVRPASYGSVPVLNVMYIAGERGFVSPLSGCDDGDWHATLRSLIASIKHPP